MIRQVVVGSIVSIILGIAVGIFYNWRAGGPYRERFDQLAGQADSQIATFASGKDFSAEDYERWQEELGAMDDEARELDVELANVRSSARRLAFAAGISAFLLWTGAVLFKRKRRRGP